MDDGYIEYDFGPGKVRNIPVRVADLLDACKEHYSTVKWTPLLVLLAYESIVESPDGKLADTLLKIKKFVTESMKAQESSGNEEDDVFACAVIIAAKCEMNLGRVIQYFTEIWPEVNSSFVWESDENGI